MMATNDRFTFFESYAGAIRGLNDAQVAELVRGMCEYAFGSGEFSPTDPIVAIVWPLIRPNMEVSMKQSAGGRRGRRKAPEGAAQAVPERPSEGAEVLGEKGGKYLSEKRASTYPISAEVPIHRNRDKEEEKEEEMGEGRACAEAPAATPQQGEVEAYFGANGWTCSAADYFDRRSAVGWRDPQGRPILDWRSDARAWARREPEFAQARAERQRAREARGRPAEAPEGPKWVSARERERLEREAFEREFGEGDAA